MPSLRDSGFPNLIVPVTAVPGYRLFPPFGSVLCSNIDDMRKVRGRAGIVAGVLLAWCACAAALDPSLYISQYAHTSWKVRDGFTKGYISSIAQTLDGYLWLGTEFGLYRFDGVRAVPWQPPAGQQLPSPYIRNLMAARDGTLWVATQKGLASWKDGKLTTYPELPGRIPFSLLEDREGTIWVGLAQPGVLCAIRSAKAQCYGSGSFGATVSALYEDRKGNLWVAGLSALWRWAPGPPQRYDLPSDVPYAYSLTEDEHGVLLLGTNNGLRQLVGGKVQSYPLRGIPSDIRAWPYRTMDGSVWIRTDQGLLHLHSGRVDKFSAHDGLSGDYVMAIFEDREASLWVSTFEGLDRFRELAVPRMSLNDGLLSALVNSVQATADGDIWIATHAGLNRYGSSRMIAYRSVSPLTENGRTGEQNPGIEGRVTRIANSGLKGVVGSLGVDDAGRLWVSTAESVFYFAAGRFVRVPGIPGQYTDAISADGHGNVWLLNGHQGLFQVRASGGVQAFPSLRPIAPPNNYWGVLLPDGSGNGLWIGSYVGGLLYFKDGQVRASYTAANGLGAGRVNRLRFGPHGSLWAATEGGLSRIKDGHIATLTSKNGLPCDDVHWSIEDDDHAVWLYMPCGLARIERAELDAWINNPNHVVKTTVFDATDGVRSRAYPNGNTPPVTKSTDGKIWFTVFDGLSVIDPHHLAFNKLPPPVHIEQVTADDKTYDATNGLRLPPHIRYLAIDYTALSLVAPEKVRFRYKLEGEDKDWREVVNDRQVQYTNLAPNQYRFRVLACNNSGVWNEQGASLEFVIPPAWYQTNWFYALCAATFLLMLWGLYHLRVLQLQREFNAALEGRVAERTRVARDIHDTLLQSFHGLLLRFGLVDRLLPGRPDDAKKELQRAMELATAAITEGRDAVQGLRDSTIEANDLVAAIETIGQELAAKEPGERSASFKVLVEGESRELRPLLRDEVYRIAAESLRNAFRHANASRIEVEIRYGDKQFRLRVRDDGKGIDPTLLKGEGPEGHYGLRGMRERAQLVGGKLAVWSELDGGTEVELTIPARNAYEEVQRSSWWWQRFSGKASDVEGTKIES